MTLSPGAELSSVTLRKLAPAAAQSMFVPLSLDRVLNAKQIDARALTAVPPADAKSSPDRDVPVTIAGVPFSLPKPNEAGQNHVDIGVSLLRQGSLEGRFPGDRDALGGRWAGIENRDPARIQLRAPQGQYRALHLLAAASNEPDRVPIVTAQFFNAGSGFPVNFVSPNVPKLGSGSDKIALPLTGDGAASGLYHVVIPLDPGALRAFSDQDYLDLELTKQVQVYRAYPDPLFYSIHAAGLPSAVHVFAATLERSSVDVELIASNYANIWTAPAIPTYTVRVTSNAGAERDVTLTLQTRSFIDQKITQQKQTLHLGKPGTTEAAAEATLKLALPCFGHHDITLTVTDGSQTWTETRSAAYLHEDTRERGNWDFPRAGEPSKGPMFGFWNWAGGHGTPAMDKQLLVMGQAGMETTHGSFNDRLDENSAKLAQQFGMRTFKFAGAGDHYITAKFADDLSKSGLETARTQFLKTLRERQVPENALNRPVLLSYFPEPSIGTHTHSMPPEFYGEPETVFSPAEEERFQRFLSAFVEGGKIIRVQFPSVKNMLPHGAPNFCIPFLRRSPEARKLFDGISVDIPCFERLPEQQIHAVALHQTYAMNVEFQKFGIARPALAMYEGPCVPNGPGSISLREHADIIVRDSLILLGYGVDFQTGGFGGFDCSSAWGEQHYGMGVLHRVPLEMPKPAYSAIATLTRQLNRCNFAGWSPTGSLTVLALRFKHYKTGEIVHVLWTLRGSRPVSIVVDKTAQPTLIDPMDNATELSPANGSVSFVIDASPRYIRGLPSDIKITLGDPDHSDAKPALVNRKLTNFGDGSWKLSEARDEGYEKSHTPYIVRFPGKMTITTTPAPSQQGGSAMSVALGKQDKERIVMPFYTTLVPAQPLVIPGKASHLGVWVKAASDWGRIVYVARDAKGEKWISVGQANAWNCDDLNSAAAFCFDGWRYLRFELPAHAAWDCYREAGTSSWGGYSPGDRIVDLPLSLEKVIIERRTHVMYVNDPQPACSDDVLLGDLYAEYENAADATPEAVRLAALRMPAPANVPELDNPITKLAAQGQGAAPSITKITLPEQVVDGTQCYVHFDKRAGAASYDIWASPYPDGRGALQLGKAWKEPGSLLRGLRPETDFYLFLTCTSSDGKVSKPSAAFSIRLQDLFGMK